MILKAKHKKILLDIFTKKLVTPASILAFGSRVNGDATSGSDLDLVIKANNNKPLSISELSNIKDELLESNIPFLVDVLDWNRIPRYFQENIQRNYEILQ
jgi:predicted nucleotidyltransferase